MLYIIRITVRLLNMIYVRYMAAVLTVLTNSHDILCADVIVENSGSGEFDPKQLADKFGMHYIGRLLENSNFHHFHHSNESRARDFERLIRRNKNIRYVNLQREKFREKRQFQINFNDPYYPKQWYLNDRSWPPHDLNVGPSWSKGITGRGVTCVVLDDGILYTNPDIAANYDERVSVDLTDLLHKSKDPFPNVKVNDFHGTNCAAVLAAVANNSYCGVGVAFDARIGGIRLLSGNVTDAQEAVSLIYANDIVDVYSASWGPRDDGILVEGPSHLARKALRYGVTHGRDGRGSIYTWASGNGGINDNCAMDGYASSLETFTVAAITRDGEPCIYSEPCASVLAAVYVGGISRKFKGDFRMRNVVAPGPDGVCHNTFQGTSAAAPLAGGVVALVLQMNPLLNWRDVQHLAVRAAIPGKGAEWNINGAGLQFHEALGFGTMDASKMVELAETWTSVPPRERFTLYLVNSPRVLAAESDCTLVAHVPENFIDFIEVVEVRVSFLLMPRGALEVRLRSSSATVSRLLTVRPRDKSVTPLKNWSLNTVHFWGENTKGDWFLMLMNHSSHEGTLYNVTITFHGYNRSNWSEP